jgi:hypothetical protein
MENFPLPDGMELVDSEISDHLEPLTATVWAAAIVVLLAVC